MQIRSCQSFDGSVGSFGYAVLVVLMRGVYIQFCPMADNNKGAYWISLEEEVRNPDYGEAMLTCGEVRDTLK